MVNEQVKQSLKVLKDSVNRQISAINSQMRNPAPFDQFLVEYIPLRDDVLCACHNFRNVSAKSCSHRNDQ
jgi:hypothetical protein